MKYFLYHQEIKLLFHWLSAVPKYKKKNVVIGDLTSFKNLSFNFEQKVKIMKAEYIKAGYLFCFINAVNDDYNNVQDVG